MRAAVARSAPLPQPQFTLLLFIGAISVISLIYYASRLRGVPPSARLNTVAAFWAVYILTRPLGASIGDWISQDKKVWPPA